MFIRLVFPWLDFYFHIWILQNSAVHRNKAIVFQPGSRLYETYWLACAHAKSMRALLSVPRREEVRISTSGSGRFSRHSCWQWSPGGFHGVFFNTSSAPAGFHPIFFFSALYPLVCLLSCPRPLLLNLHSIPLFLSHTADAVVIMWEKKKGIFSVQRRVGGDQDVIFTTSTQMPHVTCSPIASHFNTLLRWYHLLISAVGR